MGPAGPDNYQQSNQEWAIPGAISFVYPVHTNEEEQIDDDEKDKNGTWNVQKCFLEVS